jgi:hypothetical protein
MDYSSRLDPNTYIDDEPVGVAAVAADLLPGPLPGDSWSYVPEPLWQRILSLGHAYGLHFAQVTDPVVDTVLNPKQCQSFVEELVFLKRVIYDPAAEQAMSTIGDLAGKVAAGTSLRLVISPP